MPLHPNNACFTLAMVYTDTMFFLDWSQLIPTHFFMPWVSHPCTSVFLSSHFIDLSTTRYNCQIHWSGLQLVKVIYYIGVHRRMSLMSLSLLRLQCSPIIAHLTWYPIYIYIYRERERERDSDSIKKKKTTKNRWCNLLIRIIQTEGKKFNKGKD